MKPLPDDLRKFLFSVRYDETGQPYVTWRGERYSLTVMDAGLLLDTSVSVVRGIAVKQSQKVSDLEFDLREALDSRQ
jgi:hypothetical protein